jgi:hypothetical protein
MGPKFPLAHPALVAVGKDTHNMVGLPKPQTNTKLSSKTADQYQEVWLPAFDGRESPSHRNILALLPIILKLVTFTGRVQRMRQGATNLGIANVNRLGVLPCI